MQEIIKNTTINYEFYNNNSKIDLVFLHGWGQNIEMMMPLAKPFIKKYNVLLVDLPGFGASTEPNEIWSLDDYAESINFLCKKLKLKELVIVGHSFGGKIAIVYALKYKVKKLVLLASPFKKSSKKPNYKTKLLKYLKSKPKLKFLENKLKNYIGSTDYKNATPMMRNILVKHINYDLSLEVKKIKAPTLLIWGTNDEAVRVADAYELESLIPNAGLVTYESCSHYAYLERLNQTIRVLDSFIRSDE